MAKMTAGQARDFWGYSVANADLVESVLGCGCKAYEDIFTYARWQALGFQVQLGQKAVHLPLVKIVGRENKETQEVETKRIKTRSTVFCRHQVAPIADTAKAPGATTPQEPKPISATPTPASPVEKIMAQWTEV